MLPGFASWVWRVLDEQLEQALYEDHRQERAAKHLCDLHSALGFTSVGHLLLLPKRFADASGHAPMSCLNPMTVIRFSKCVRLAACQRQSKVLAPSSSPMRGILRPRNAKGIEKGVV